MKIYHKPKNMQRFSVYVQYHDWPITHTHTYWEILLFTSGTPIHKINGKTRTLSQHTLCVVRPNDVHSLHNLPEQNSSHIALRISCEYFESFVKCVDESLFYALISSNEPLEYPLKRSTANRVIDSANKIFTASSQETYDSQCNLLFLDIFRAFYHKIVKEKNVPTQYGKAVTQLIDMINRPENLKKDVKTLIASLNYSYSHIHRLFTAETGIPPSKYLQRQKLHYAKQLLTERDMDLQSIAYEVGYTNYSHFSVAFQKEVGVSPFEYRKNQDNYLLNVSTV